MKTIQIAPNPSGAYPGIQNSSSVTVPKGRALWPDTLSEKNFYDYNGFVALTFEDVDGVPTVTSCEPNTEAWEAWTASLPAEPDPVVAAREVKETEISAACNAAIVAGMDVETTVGVEHFSLQETDQINLTTALGAVQAGAETYPYHADGSLCRMFTAAEIQAIADAATAHKLYHTTLCNHLLTWVRRAETVEEIEGITYSADNLPEDLAANMVSILAAASASL